MPPMANTSEVQQPTQVTIVSRKIVEKSNEYYPIGINNLLAKPYRNKRLTNKYSTTNKIVQSSHQINDKLATVEDKFAFLEISEKLMEVICS